MNEQPLAVPVSRERIAELRTIQEEFYAAAESKGGLLSISFGKASGRLLEAMLESFPALLDRAAEANRLERENARLREQKRLLHDAVITLRVGMGGHNHFDHTQQYGAGCETCKMQREAVKQAGLLIDQVAELEQTANEPERKNP